MAVAIICDANHLVSGYSECHLPKQRLAAVASSCSWLTAIFDGAIFGTVAKGSTGSYLMAMPVLPLLERLLLN